ncbi:hypothetical protein F5887DRAFT_917207 [Amanita rubescens]|nr:hypothetical protein F5887DRAFT_917207 [Amanita rubescens]
MVDDHSGLHKDPVTGEMVSKTELRRRQKQGAKAEKAPAQPATNAKEEKVNEDELNPNQYYELRSRQILKATQSPNPYPHVTRSMTITSFINTYGEEGKHTREPRRKAALHNIRPHGKLIFYEPKEQSRVQPKRKVHFGIHFSGDSKSTSVMNLPSLVTAETEKSLPPCPSPSPEEHLPHVVLSVIWTGSTAPHLAE